MDWRKNIRMQLYKIEISELAAQDLEAVGDYIAFVLKNSSAAINTIRGIREKINTLRCFPERNNLDEDTELAEFGVKMEYYRDYKIYYIVKKDTVYIIRILHMLVDSKMWLYQTFVK